MLIATSANVADSSPPLHRDRPFTDLHWQRAVDAYAHFGKGRHPAGLNFGDCMTYATAALARQPLLCRGDDFSKTDLEVVRL